MLSQSKLKLHKLRVRLLKPNKFNKARFKMEKLLQDLESQVSCSICFEFLQTPKILPCFHAFCLQCLNRMAAHHAGGGKFKCPTCRATTLIPQPEGNFRFVCQQFPAQPFCWICWPSRKLGTLQRCVETVARQLLTARSASNVVQCFAVNQR